MHQARHGRHPRLSAPVVPGLRLGSLLMGVLLCAGCGVSGLNFRQDDRLSIVSPPNRTEVDLPVTVEWTVDEFRVTGRDGGSENDAGYFGVFVDRAPPPPGKTPASLVEDTQSCRIDPTCPDEEYLARQDIHTTTATTFTIERLAEPDESQLGRRNFHEVTVVLLDGRGRRIGETAAIVRFEVPD